MQLRYLLVAVSSMFSLPVFAAAPIEVTNYPAGTLIGDNLAWLKPDGVARSEEEATLFCKNSTAGGVSGWRLPTRDEISHFYYNRNQAQLQNAAWPAAAYWTASIEDFSGQQLVFNTADGATAYAGSTHQTVCVRYYYPLPAGFLKSGNLMFLPPDASTRNFPTADAYCAAQSASGRRGWRLPTVYELANLYHERGAGAISAAGWPSGWLWSNTPGAPAYHVFRMTDGLPSTAGGSNAYNVTCVHDDNDPLPVSTLVHDGLRWARPETTVRNWGSAAAACSASTLGGVGGWRLPSMAELGSLYYSKGATFLSSFGFGASWIWASDVQGAGHSVLRFSDGLPSYDVSGSNYTVCVRSAADLPPAHTPTLQQGGMVWSKPVKQAMPWANAQYSCSWYAPNPGLSWRMPSQTEVAALYAEKGAAWMQAAGFPADPANLWTLPGPTTSSLPEGNGARHLLACVSDQSAYSNSASGAQIVGADVWAKTGPTLRPWYATEKSCDEALYGQSGWRLPKRSELQTLRATLGASGLSQLGWATDWYWAFNPQSSGFQVLRMTDGLTSWAAPTESNRYTAACIHDANGLPAGSVQQGGLTWARPGGVPRAHWAMLHYCQGQNIGGLSGWRMPSTAEVTALVAAIGGANLVNDGWPAGYIWTATPASSGNQAVRISDGVVSYATAADSNRLPVACVRAN
ncbi:hypothetical protein V8J88_19850 [Massilia sp. W12]|uniref:hypothetical protein n=1 Tax=Massilia sp. W12 TaxID=3126507 RepID=UPI0030D0546C